MNKHLLMVPLFLLFAASQVQAANLNNPVNGIFRASYGDSISIEIPSTVSKSPDSAPGGELTFQINPSTYYKGFNTLTDLKTGDPVEVGYTTDAKSGKLIAVELSRDNSQTTTVQTTSQVVPENSQTVTEIKTTTVSTTTTAPAGY